jgi:hypothetical protein
MDIVLVKIADIKHIKCSKIQENIVPVQIVYKTYRYVT